MAASFNYRRWKQLRRGQSLIEFAAIALVMYMLLAAILTFGHLLFGAQVIQSAADVGARELSRTPLNALDDFETTMTDGSVTSRVFDRDLLVFKLPAPPYNMNDIVAAWPVLNQQLYALMILDTLPDGTAVLRYPGTLVSDSSDTDTGLTVKIPLLDAAGTQITWVEVVEEVDTEDAFIGEQGDDAGTSPDPFKLTSDPGGLVALRVNYPFQAAAMSAYRPSVAGTFEPNSGNVIENSDSGYSETNSSRGTVSARPLVDDRGTADTSDDVYTGPYGGTYGLGAQGAWGKTVRPFRRVISVQAIYRREVFQ